MSLLQTVQTEYIIKSVFGFCFVKPSQNIWAACAPEAVWYEVYF